MKREFAELKMLVAGLREAVHDHPVGNGWTVATLLGVRHTL
jgi:hypothetical protein